MSAKHNMSSKIVGWLVGDWDGKKSDFKKNLNKKKISELNLKMRNPVFLPIFTLNKVIKQIGLVLENIFALVYEAPVKIC